MRAEAVRGIQIRLGLGGTHQLIVLPNSPSDMKEGANIVSEQCLRGTDSARVGLSL